MAAEIVSLEVYRAKKAEERCPSLAAIEKRLRQRYGANYRFPAGEPPLDELEIRLWEKYGHIPCRLEHDAWLEQFWSLADA